MESGWKKILAGKCLCSVAIMAFTVLMAVEGTWGTGLQRHPLMWAVAALMLLSLASIIIVSVREKSRIDGVLSHLGMFLLVAGTLCGAPAFVDAQMTVCREWEENEAVSRDGLVVQLPFGIRLVEYRTEYYEDGVSPKQYISTIQIEGKTFQTSVNHPCRYRGYRIYQYNYDPVDGAYSGLKLVRDPWLPVIFLGMLLMAAGALMGLGKLGKGWGVYAAMGALAVLFAVISLARIRFGTLMPALRSLWFVPHLVFYMLAYAALALSTVTGVISLFKSTGSLRVWSVKLLGAASSLLLLGMLCGAVWAKVAWGDWWTWDAKECWAAVTWLLTLLGTHLPARLQRHRSAVLVCIILAFLAMQVAWYGVDLLPAARLSLHTYR